MNGRGQRPQTECESGRGSVQKFVTNAVNPAGFGSAHLFPAAVTNNFLERNAVARAAPGGDKYIGILGKYSFGGGLFPRTADEGSAGCLHQFGDPWLRGNQGLAPFLTEYARARRAGSLLAGGRDVLLHFLDRFFATLEFAHDSRDGGNVGVDVVECLRSEAKKACSGLQDFRYRLFLVGDGSDDQVRLGDDDLISTCGP